MNLASEKVERKCTKERVALLVDVQSLYHCAKSRYQCKIDYAKLLHGVTREKHLVRALAYVARRSEGEQNGFMAALSNQGYELRVLEQPPRSSLSETNRQSRSVWIAVDTMIMIMSTPIDRVILATVESDIAPVLLAIKYFKCKAEVLGVEGCTPNPLVDFPDKFTSIPMEWLFKEPKFEETRVKHSERFRFASRGDA